MPERAGGGAGERGGGHTLILSRKKEQRICLGDDVEIVVIEVKGGCVRLGIKAPASVRISRGELRQATWSLNHKASGHQTDDAQTAEEMFAGTLPRLKTHSLTTDNHAGSQRSPVGTEAGVMKHP